MPLVVTSLVWLWRSKLVCRVCVKMEETWRRWLGEDLFFVGLGCVLRQKKFSLMDGHPVNPVCAAWACCRFCWLKKTHLSSTTGIACRSVFIMKYFPSNQSLTSSSFPFIACFVFPPLSAFHYSIRIFLYPFCWTFSVENGQWYGDMIHFVLNLVLRSDWFLDWL